MGFINRPVGRLSPYPNSSSLKEVSSVQPQVSTLSVHLSSLRPTHGPPNFYNDCKGGETHGPLQRHQNSPILGQLAHQGQVSGRRTTEHSDRGGPDSVLRLDNQPGEVRTPTHPGILICGLPIPSRFSPCKTHDRQMAQTSGLDPENKVKAGFDCKMFDVTNWATRLNGEDGPRGSPSHETLRVAFQGALEISSILGHPPSLVRDHISSPRLVAKPCQCSEWIKTSSQRPQFPALYRRLKRRFGHSLKARLLKRAVVIQAEKPTHECSRAKRIPGLVSELNSAGSIRKHNSGSLHKQTGVNPVQRCTLLWRIMTWCHHHRITLRARHIPGCLNVMADSLSRSNQTHSTEWSLHPQVFKQICQKWFTPLVDLFATRLA